MLLPITGITDRSRRLYPLFLAPIVLVATALLFPLPSAITPAALPQERSLELTNRVLVQLAKAETKEPDPWMRDDIRIAWITVKWAAEGVPDWCWYRTDPPYVAATRQVLRGLRPDQVWPAILARRKALLGKEWAPESPRGETAESTAHAPNGASYKVPLLPLCASSGQTASTELTRRSQRRTKAGIPSGSGRTQNSEKLIKGSLARVAPEEKSTTDIPHKTAKRFPMGTGRLVDEEPSADGASSLPAYEKRRA